jgi:hypothetical protein
MTKYNEVYLKKLVQKLQITKVFFIFLNLKKIIISYNFNIVSINSKIIIIFIF